MPVAQVPTSLDFDDFLAAFPENEDKTGKSFSQPSEFGSNQSYCNQEESYVNIFNESMPALAITDEFFMQVADENHLNFEDSQIIPDSATCPIQPPIPLFVPPQTPGANNVFLNHNDTDLKYNLNVGFLQGQQNVVVSQLDNDLLQLLAEKDTGSSLLSDQWVKGTKNTAQTPHSSVNPSTLYVPEPKVSCSFELARMNSLDEELSTNPKASNVFSGLSSPSSHYQWIDLAGFEPLNSLNVTEAEALGQIGMFGKPKLITDEVNSQINPDETLTDSFIVHP